MMSINRYRLKHKVRQKNAAAIRVRNLLQRTDRLLTTILIGNTFANILASAIATMLASQFFGDVGILISTILLTFLVLIFAEIIPKTLAANQPQWVAFHASRPLQLIQKILSPVIWLTAKVTNLILKRFKLEHSNNEHEALTKEELRTVVADTGKLPGKHKHMLLGVLDLEQACVEEVMIPRYNVYAVDFTQPLEKILTQIYGSPYSKLPIYEGSFEKIIGILPLYKLSQHISAQNPITEKQQLLNLIKPAYFIPEAASLQQQLVQFQQTGNDLALVVDEYGDIQGIATVEDVLEEIVGHFISDQPTSIRKPIPQTDGSYILAGSMTIRDVNRLLGLQLPTSGAKTLSGLMTEYLQTLPTAKTCLKVQNIRMEIMQTEDNQVKKAKIYPL